MRLTYLIPKGVGQSVAVISTKEAIALLSRMPLGTSAILYKSRNNIAIGDGVDFNVMLDDGVKKVVEM